MSKESILRAIKQCPSKVSQVKDAQNRVTTKRATLSDLGVGHPCLITQYAYDAADATDPNADFYDEGPEIGVWNPELADLEADIWEQLLAHMRDYGTGAEHQALSQNLNDINDADAKGNDNFLYRLNYAMRIYEAHMVDALKVTPVDHQAQGTDYNLASYTVLTSVKSAHTVLNDFRTKLLAHDADAVAHTTGSQHQLTAAAITSNWEKTF